MCAAALHAKILPTATNNPPAGDIQSTRKGIRTMIKTTLRYARYALAALASIGFGVSFN